ncbi:hypothetical protein AAC387_Pa08g2267 [Persea americana]
MNGTMSAKMCPQTCMYDKWRCQYAALLARNISTTDHSHADKLNLRMFDLDSTPSAFGAFFRADSMGKKRASFSKFH